MLHVINKLCAPSIIYFGFSIISASNDLYNKQYENAFIHLMSLIIITFLLDILCKKGFSTISWLIVFIPFMLMSLIITTIIYIVGINKHEQI
jgi:hypothetical protein